MNTAILGAICTIIGALITAVAYYLSGKNKKKMELLENKVFHLRSELLQIYCDVNELLQIEAELTDLAGISKKQARKGHHISAKCQPANVQKRIDNLQKQLDIL